MRRFLKHAAHSRTRLFVPVVEYGLTEFAVTVRHIAPRPMIKAVGLGGDATTQSGVATHRGVNSATGELCRSSKKSESILIQTT